MASQTSPEEELQHEQQEGRDGSETNNLVPHQDALQDEDVDFQSLPPELAEELAQDLR